MLEKMMTLKKAAQEKCPFLLDHINFSGKTNRKYGKPALQLVACGRRIQYICLKNKHIR